MNISPFISKMMTDNQTDAIVDSVSKKVVDKIQKAMDKSTKHRPYAGRVLLSCVPTLSRPLVLESH